MSLDTKPTIDPGAASAGIPSSLVDLKPKVESIDLKQPKAECAPSKIEESADLSESTSEVATLRATGVLSYPVDLKPEVKCTPSKTKESADPSESTSEVTVLRALLAQKAEESLEREVKLRKDLFKVEKENTKLRREKTAYAARIGALEAEIARMVKPSVKKEQNSSRGAKSSRSNTKEVIMILDSEDEQDKDDSPASFPAIPDMQPPSETPVEDTNTLRDLNGTPSLETLSPSGPTPSEQSLTQRRTCDPDIQAKEEVIDVVIKTEGGPDEFKRVTLIKSEDGSFDIWNVDGFGLGPTIPVDEKYNRGFTRKVISDAFGGGHMECYHNWKKPKPSQETKAPFLTFNRSWNNALPVSPGAHGMGFFGMSSSPTGLKPLNFFVGEGTNNWRLSGTYDFHRWGEIATRHVSLLPPHVLDNWAHGMATTQWGKAAIEDANADLKDPAKVVVATKDSVLQAIRDGRITIPFTILRCVGYPQDWFERLLYYEKHPKPKKPTAPKTPRKRAGPKANGSPKKQARTSQKGKRKAVKVESASEASEEETDVEIYKQEPDDDEEYVGDHSGSRPIAGLPIRTSPRKMQSLRMSVEL